MKQLDAILEAVNAIGEALNRQMLRGWPNTPDAPVKLREALVDLLVQLYRWQGHAAATAEPPNPPADGEKTMAFAAETLEVLREFFRALGVALQVDDRELERHLDPASREEIYEDTFIAPATKLDDLEKRKTRSTCNRYTFSRKTGAAQKVEEEELAALAADRGDDAIAGKAKPSRLAGKGRKGLIAELRGKAFAPAPTPLMADEADEDRVSFVSRKATPGRSARQAQHLIIARWRQPGAESDATDGR